MENRLVVAQGWQWWEGDGYYKAVAQGIFVLIVIIFYLDWFAGYRNLQVMK